MKIFFCLNHSNNPYNYICCQSRNTCCPNTNCFYKCQVYHNIYNSWSWLGGHADGETDLLAVALREVKEEAGISHVSPVSEEIFSLESLTVDGHVKKGKYVSSHLHLNVTYLLEADSEEAVSIKADENSGVAWFSPEEALKKSTEPWFVEHVYSKLIEKMK